MSDVTVLGAGIAGLAAALALARRGRSVRVLERAGSLAEVGAGIQVSPNGMAVIDALGVGEALREAGQASHAVVLRDGPRGTEVARMSQKAGGRDPRPWLMLHRTDLLDVLARAATQAGVTIQTGRAAASLIATADDGHVITFEDGTSEEVATLVAADGIRSVARTALNPPGLPRFSGQVAWRALVPGDAQAPVAPGATVFLGPGRHLVRYPLRGGALVNVVAVEERADWAPDDWAAPGVPDEMRAAFAGFCPEVRALLDRVERCHLWGLFTRPVAARWHGNGLFLAGDAAHPTLPFLAQGANLALEDAWVLARCLAELPPARAGAAYQAARQGRARRAISAAAATARSYHLSHPAARGLAHGLLRVAGRVAPASISARYDWLHRFEVTTAPIPGLRG